MAAAEPDDGGRAVPQFAYHQAAEIARIFRIPAYMIGVSSGSSSRGSNIIDQEAEDFRNSTLTSHTDLWHAAWTWRSPCAPRT